MANPTLTVTLAKSSDSVTFPAPSIDNDAAVNMPGVVHQTQGGSLVQYQVGPPYFEATLNIDGITDVQKDALDVFFRAHWGDALVYTDAKNNTFTAHFLDQDLGLHKLYGNWWQAKIKLRLDSVLK